MKPLISIIIPAYNVEDKIQRCIDSITCQPESSNIEIIIVNDGSKDNTGTVCDSIAASVPNVRVLHVDNGGPSRARNIGLDNASGEWITFIDSDDEVCDDYLSTLMSEGMDTDITFFGLKELDENSGIEREYTHPALSAVYSCEEIEIAIQSLMTSKGWDTFGFTVSKILKRSIIEKYSIRFQQNLTFMEDEIFSLEYCKHIASLRILSKALYKYYIYDNSITRSNAFVHTYPDLINAYFLKATEFKTSELTNCLIEKGTRFQLQATLASMRNHECTHTIKERIKTIIRPNLEKGICLKDSRLLSLINVIPPFFRNLYIYYVLKRIALTKS